MKKIHKWIYCILLCIVIGAMVYSIYTSWRQEQQLTIIQNYLKEHHLSILGDTITELIKIVSMSGFIPDFISNSTIYKSYILLNGKCSACINFGFSGTFAPSITITDEGTKVYELIDHSINNNSKIAVYVTDSGEYLYTCGNLYQISGFPGTLEQAKKQLEWVSWAGIGARELITINISALG